MGYTRKILAEKKLNEKSVFYTDKFRIDLAESIHVHYRNFRLEFSLEEWKIFAKGIVTAYARWWSKGKPGYQPTAHNWSLFQGRVDPVAGKGEKSVVQNTIAIELSQFADYIHVHFRNTRYEFTVDEFLEFADEIAKARDEIRSMPIMRDYPKRVGFDHVMQPKNRVTESKNPGGFVTHESRFPDEKSRTYDTVILDEETGEWKRQVSYHDDLEAIRQEPGLIRRIAGKIARCFLALVNSIFKFF